MPKIYRERVNKGNVHIRHMQTVIKFNFFLYTGMEAHVDKLVSGKNSPGRWLCCGDECAD